MKSQFFLILTPILIASLGVACAPEPAPPAEVPAAVASLPKVVPRVERLALRMKGYAARDAKDYAACADHFGASGADFIAAGCQAMAGNQETAFAYLARAIDGRFDDLEDFDGDANLKSLQGDPRWAAERVRLEAKIAEEAKRNNGELVRLHDEDQADRRGKAYKDIDWSKVTPRDQQRRARVNEILAAGGGKTATDYVNAALVFQHGETPEEVWRAHELALKAVELDPEHDFARWLTAASEDRFLVYQKKPQKWGTQYHAEGDKWVLDEVGSDVTDEQRAEWNVPPLPKKQPEAKQSV